MKRNKLFKSMIWLLITVSIVSFSACEIISSTGGNSANGSQANGNTVEVTGTGSYTLCSGTATKSNETLTASEKDQSAAIVSNGASLTLNHMRITTSGNSSSMDSSSFYGLNAAVLAKADSRIFIYMNFDLTKTRKSL